MLYAKAGVMANAIAGIAPMGGAGIFGSCKQSVSMPDRNTLAAGWFDGDVIIKNGNISNDNGVIQAGQLKALNGWNGSFKGKSVKVEMGIITNVW